MKIAAEGSWGRPFLATMGLAALVAAGVGDGGAWFSLTVLVAAGLGFGVLFRLFPRGLDFALGAGIGFVAAPERWARTSLLSSSRVSVQIGSSSVTGRLSF